MTKRPLGEAAKSGSGEEGISGRAIQARSLVTRVSVEVPVINSPAECTSMGSVAYLVV
jgi:hypothetical protein